MSRVMVAMSGGVDSSVTAMLLQKQGHDVCGVTGKFFSRLSDGSFSVDCPISDIQGADARAVADGLGMQWTLLDLRKEFMRDVLLPFADIYERGGTPNPCLICNSFIKFGALLDYALAHQCDKLATGHYARVSYEGGRWHLKRAVNRIKDQSYFLFSLTQRQLSHILFPLGEISKEQTRAIAHDAGIVTAAKKDSQDICFVAGEYVPVLTAITGHEYAPGNFVKKNGEIIGEHRGAVRYTIGQRKGLGLSLSEPLYVCDKDMENNTVVLCSNDELNSDTLTVSNYNEICPLTDAPLKCTVKIRSTGEGSSAEITRLGGGRVRVVFDEPQRAIARGQAAVMYDGDDVLGGGIIE